MATAEHLALLQRGTAIWNDWRVANPEFLPELSKAELLGAKLSGANLSGADLTQADLRLADLAGADLRQVDFLLKLALFLPN